MNWTYYRRLFRIAYSEYKRYRLIAEIEGMAIAALVAALLCKMR